MIENTQKERLIGHIARDSTAIEARERFPENPPLKRRREKHRRGPKPKRSTPRSRIEEQRRMPLAEMLAGLPQHCSLGVKQSSKGHLSYWRGYKLHLDVADGQIPIAALLTGACVHDSQAAIPLMTLSSARVTYLYDLMDTAYDAHQIDAHSRSLGHVPLIAPNGVAAALPPPQSSLERYDKRRKTPTRCDRKRLPFTPAEEQRFRLRSMVERVYSRLKDEFGVRFIRVRGASKIMAHLMFGVLALTVDQLLKLTG